ncbi:hypothetical protein GOV10_06370 [Candidatus Woesearchaeota archaeon]|nr:hypothetical protein [Candidatus Woesearchaeota archaeon]
MARNVISRCPECGSMNMQQHPEKGEVVCADCGLVIEDKMIDHDKEWRDVNDDSAAKRRRTGAPMTYTQADRGLSTQIGTQQELRKLGNSKFFRLKRWQQRTMTGLERNLRQALSEIHQLTSSLQLSRQVEEETARIYTMAAQKGLAKGRQIEELVAASCYIACRNFDVPKHIKEISERSRVDRKILHRNYKHLIRNLNLRVNQSDPTDFVFKFASKLNLSAETQTLAIDIIEQAKAKAITSGKSPVGIVGGAIYIASMLNKEKRTQSQIAKEIGATEVTVRNRYKDLIENLDLKIVEA